MFYIDWNLTFLFELLVLDWGKNVKSLEIKFFCLFWNNLESRKIPILCYALIGFLVLFFLISLILKNASLSLFWIFINSTLSITRTRLWAVILNISLLDFYLLYWVISRILDLSKSTSLIFWNTQFILLYVSFIRRFWNLLLFTISLMSYFCLMLGGLEI